jgi:hypothetical protein
MRLILIFVMAVLPIALGLPLSVSSPHNSENEAGLISELHQESSETLPTSVIKRDGEVVSDASEVLDRDHLVVVSLSLASPQYFLMSLTQTNRMANRPPASADRTI